MTQVWSFLVPPHTEQTLRFTRLVSFYGFVFLSLYTSLVPELCAWGKPLLRFPHWLISTLVENFKSEFESKYLSSQSTFQVRVPLPNSLSLTNSRRGESVSQNKVIHMWRIMLPGYLLAVSWSCPLCRSLRCIYLFLLASEKVVNILTCCPFWCIRNLLVPLMSFQGTLRRTWRETS